jgi:hypothetical protein
MSGSNLYKVSVIEFVTLPAKAVLSAVFNYVKKDGHAVMGSVVSAEGFMGIRKL